MPDFWYSESLASRAARLALSPLSWTYARVASLNNPAPQTPVIPALSIGNLSVGGTGKTPVAAWAAQQLRARGGHPAIVLRGYGADEPLVHVRLNPDVPVIAMADRLRGAKAAAAKGADCVVLDDAFQHRRIARVSDWVLIAAESWRDDLQVLPAGPLRESPTALGRADVIVVTRKSATLNQANDVAERLARYAPAAGVAILALEPSLIVRAAGAESFPLEWLQSRAFTAVAAIGVPDAFFAQLERVGATITRRAYRDHHAFTAADVAEIVRSAKGADGVICTLKDAVKLAPQWPASAPTLYYVSQSVVVEKGGARLDMELDKLLAARQLNSPAG